MDETDSFINDPLCLSSIALMLVVFLALYTRTNIKKIIKPNLSEDKPKTIQIEQINPTIIRRFRDSSGFIHIIEEIIYDNREKRKCSLISNEGNIIHIDDWGKLRSENMLAEFSGNYETTWFCEDYNYTIEYKNKLKRLELALQNKDKELIQKHQSFHKQAIQLKETMKEIRKAEGRGGSLSQFSPYYRYRGWGQPYIEDNESGED